MHLPGTPPTWSESDRLVPRTVLRPLQRVMAQTSSGAAVMALVVVCALVVANTGASTAYEKLWSTPAGLTLGDWDPLGHLTLRDWVNDGLMTLFFLLVALELKRERTMGHLRDTRAALLPIVAAAGGMLVPAGVFLLLNARGPGAHGWGIPMATDIVFAVALVGTLGSRVPMGARVFLLTLAVVDDLGGILVIAVFYADRLVLGWLGGAVVTVLVAVALRRLQVRSVGVFVVLGMVCWLCLFLSGVHPTVSGVVFGLLAPARAFHDPAHFGRHARSLLERLDGASSDRLESTLHDVRRLARESRSPLARVEAGLAPWVTFGVVPLFAFANAGITLAPGTLADVVGQPVSLGVAAGLVVGKPVGVLLAVVLLSRAGLPLPSATSWSQLGGLAVLAGIGFTVALFIGDIAYADPALVDSAKTGVLAGSLIAATLGYVWLRWCARPPRPVVARARGQASPGATTRLGIVTKGHTGSIDTPAAADQPRV